MKCSTLLKKIKQKHYHCTPCYSPVLQEYFEKIILSEKLFAKLEIFQYHSIIKERPEPPLSIDMKNNLRNYKAYYLQKENKENKENKESKENNSTPLLIIQMVFKPWPFPRKMGVPLMTFQGEYLIEVTIFNKLENIISEIENQTKTKQSFSTKE